MVTLKDIATELDVSATLVSKVLNNRLGKIGCSREKQKAILATARKMNYRPSSSAVALRTGRKSVIAVFIQSLGETGSGLVETLMKGIAGALNAHGQRLWLSFLEMNPHFMREFAATAAQEVDGLIMAGLHHREWTEAARRIEKGGTPVVSIGEEPVGSGIPNVSSDLRGQTYLSTEHLIRRGCRCIGHIHCLDRRQEGYRAALHDHGLPFHADLVFRATDFKIDQGRGAVRFWLKRGIAVDGIVAQSDHQALGAVSELLRSGVRVPEDVRVIGMDDSPLCEAGPVALSSVSQEMDVAGRLAVGLLLRRIRGERAESAVVPPRLQVRAST